MKTTLLYRFLFVIAFTGALSSCNKSNSSNNSTSNADLQTNSDDATRVSTETDAAFNDVNSAMTAQYSVTGAATGREMQQRVLDGPGGSVDSGLICDGTITMDTASNPRTITITYNGNNCSLNRTRKGNIVISWPAGQLWRDSGAVVT
ncbi:MAG TPA: hypothetical protein VKU83_04160, partial [Puia sp.]|nr:hypothetical protein [Puia sp.]